MKKLIKIILVVLSVGVIASAAFFIGGIWLIGKIHEPIYQPETRAKKVLQNGDIIFQSSQSDQSIAIQLATHSKYSHMGIV